ncbi:bifunctional 2-C-methyl-D-erythritol 4-phosphate cytidylyltransferase/2-C-methyl-D-erythritol 2,4-cyclodiphosphate synthase [Litoreibacter roseus]|uniref:Bifunctional enzyme IspD/IspF n=1 Tax=Litoreibacter roseus TaxID=2601869 RepID=A0A6N6JNH7_9RHOB|nr:bifunctional 2-C-methyl-D-erythritol 4-phosphate cytidylyltransferase/2-C-methyl-D-erythritol 2,4-cyclodiphosphate synthase [Litoreibacter roseus]GFE66892.1 bifunctional enzyme IspD/IspF [Litoreibacter roseus]
MNTQDYPEQPIKTAALIVAAGRGTRAGGDLPKQWQKIGRQSVVAHTVSVFETMPQIDEIILVIHPDDTAHASGFSDAGVKLVDGGTDRAGSVRNGLAAVDPTTRNVLIHDVARPCVSQKIIGDVIAALKTHDGAAPGLAVTDALWTVSDTKVTGKTSRDHLARAQTPQGFHLDKIIAAHDTYSEVAADDVEVALSAGLTIAIVPGSEDNLKITLPEDFERAERILDGTMATLPDIRTGNGFDVHRFGPGDHVMLCGIEVAHDRGLQGHSDADVGLHTITDAIYGALCQGDIGQHFPPSDDKWKGTASHVFLEHARDLARQTGFRLTHVDCTLICELPKIGPHATAMRENVATLLEIPVDRVSVKATTSERLGFTGRGEGIACMATATLVRP